MYYNESMFCPYCDMQPKRTPSNREGKRIGLDKDNKLEYLLTVRPSSHLTAYFNAESIALSHHICLFSTAIMSKIQDNDDTAALL